MNISHTYVALYESRRLPSWLLGIMLLLMLTHGAIDIAGASLAANPVLSYDWGGDYGAVVVDSSGNGNNGTNYNTNIYSMGNGYKYRTFDTSGQYVITPPSSSLNVGTITIEGIFSTGSRGVTQTICLKRDYPSNGYWYGIDVTGCFYFYVYNSGEDRLYLTNISVDDGNVHYITVTYDGQRMNFYDFGALKESRDWGSYMPIGPSDSYFYTGTPAGQHPFNGNLYLLRVTDRALSPSEVKMNVDNEAGRVQSIPPQSQSSYDIMVKTGLNLVSLPLVNNSIWASQLGAYGIRRVSEYDNGRDAYNTYVLGFSPSADDIRVLPDRSYFMDSTLDFKIREYGVAQEPRYITISPGWNAVGWTSLSTIKASGLGGRLSDIQRICRYNTTRHDFDVYVVGFSRSDANFDIKPGEGYFVYLQSNVPESLKLGG